MAYDDTTRESDNPLAWAGSLCSILGLVAIITLQSFEFNNYTLLFWWLTTAVIAIASISACFTPPSFPLRAVFAIVFVAQIPAFNWAWAERYERDTRTGIRFGFGTPRNIGDQQVDKLQSKLEELERERSELERKNSELELMWKQTILFWQGIAHLTGIGFSLLACTASGQQRIRMVRES